MCYHMEPWTIVMIDDLRILTTASDVFYELVFYRGREPRSHFTPLTTDMQ